MSSKLTLSTLPKTWILDLDGTLVKHNGYLTDAGDELLPHVEEFFRRVVREGDKIIILTARSADVRSETEAFLGRVGLRYDHIVFDAPVGERILINDRKPSGLATALCVNLARDAGPDISVFVDVNL
jgi:ribonucleotide monophosphatase NagD (HAD superfamily)